MKKSVQIDSSQLGGSTVSVVILNWNGAKYLKQTMPLLSRLTHHSCEIIVVDNGSRDDSLKVISEYKEIKVIGNPDNLGYAKAKNQGVAAASGKYVLLLDNDILIRDLDILNDLLRITSTKTGFVQVLLVDKDATETDHYGLFFCIYGVNSHIPKIPFTRILQYEKETVEIGAATGGAMFFRKAVWEHLGGLDEIQSFNLDDIDIGARAWIYGYQNVLYTKKYFIHLGVAHVSDTRVYASRFKLLFSGHAISMIKNYELQNFLIRFPVFSAFQLTKAVRYAIKRRSLIIIFAFLVSVSNFVCKVPYALRQRKKIQSHRISADTFLLVEVPKF